jgi:hypothetical protein
MIKQIKEYGDSLLLGAKQTQKLVEFADKKNQVIFEVLNYYNIGMSSILFVGFNPAMLSSRFKKVSATGISIDGQEWIQQNSQNTIEFIDFEKISG